MSKILTNLNIKIKPIIKDNNLINIRFYYGKNNIYKLYFRDFWLILPSSLKKLGKNFNTNIKKNYFPYCFINSINILLNCIVNLFTIDHFDTTFLKNNNNNDNDNNFTIDNCNKYCKEFETKKWDLKNKLIKYCKIDIISLWQIIKKFQKNIFIKFEINILSTPILFFLVLTIYKLYYFKDSKILIITNYLYNNLKKSYSDSNIDLYKSHSKNFIDII